MCVFFCIFADFSDNNCRLILMILLLLNKNRSGSGPNFFYSAANIQNPVKYINRNSTTVFIFFFIRIFFNQINKELIRPSVYLTSLYYLTVRPKPSPGIPLHSVLQKWFDYYCSYPSMDTVLSTVASVLHTEADFVEVSVPFL